MTIPTPEYLRCKDLMPRDRQLVIFVSKPTGREHQIIHVGTYMDGRWWDASKCWLPDLVELWYPLPSIPGNS